MSARDIHRDRRHYTSVHTLVEEHTLRDTWDLASPPWDLRFVVELEHFFFLSLWFFLDVSMEDSMVGFDE